MCRLRDITGLKIVHIINCGKWTFYLLYIVIVSSPVTVIRHILRRYYWSVTSIFSCFCYIFCLFAISPRQQYALIVSRETIKKDAVNSIRFVFIVSRETVFPFSSDQSLRMTTSTCPEISSEACSNETALSNLPLNFFRLFSAAFSSSL